MAEPLQLELLGAWPLKATLGPRQQLGAASSTAGWLGFSLESSLAGSGLASAASGAASGAASAGAPSWVGTPSAFEAAFTTGLSSALLLTERATDRTLLLGILGRASAHRGERAEANNAMNMQMYSINSFIL